jgi:flagellar hook assembly protein FlgD
MTVEKGGTIIFTFVQPAAVICSMGFLDTDNGIVVKVSHTTEEGTVETKFDLPVYGDNSKQTLEINIKNVKPVTVTFAQSGEVTHVNFCHQDANDGISNKPSEQPRGTKKVLQSPVVNIACVERRTWLLH